MRLPTLLLVSASLFAGSALGCGGAKKSANEGNGDSVVEPAIDAQAEESPEEKFARQKDDAVDKMCQRLIDCSIADAQSKMSPEELAELDVENTSRQAIADCSQHYDAVEMSPRQVINLRECLGQPTECPEFGTCLEKGMAPAEEATPQE